MYKYIYSANYQIVNKEKCYQVLQLSAHFLPKTLCNQLFSRALSDNNSSELLLCCLLASVASRYNKGESIHVRVDTSTYTCTDPSFCARYRKCRTKLQEDSKLHQKGNAPLSTLLSAEMSAPPAMSIKILTHVDFKTRTSKQNPLLIPTPFQNSRATFLMFGLLLPFPYIPFSTLTEHQSPWTQILFHFDSCSLLLLL